MAHHYVAQDKVRDEHWEPLAELIQDRRTKLADVQRWLAQRGYGFTRGAVYSFMRALREGRLPAGWFGGSLRGANLRRLSRAAVRLTAEEAAELADFAEFLVQRREAKQGTGRRKLAGVRRQLSRRAVAGHVPAAPWARFRRPGGRNVMGKRAAVGAA